MFPAAGVVQVGYERRSPDRPAGIRTMSLTSIGVACFTLSSMFAFQSGPMKWDSSRITADIPKGEQPPNNSKIRTLILTDSHSC
jgi:uncharacterized membrane protein YhiD involved in acid resistance